MASPTTSIQQIDRLGRHYNRFLRLDSGQPHNDISTFYEDVVYDFFVNCYHLKDWIKADPALPNEASQVENYISSSAELSLCADICNGVKHYTLTRPRSNANPKMQGQHIKLNIGLTPTPQISIKFNIDTNSGPIDAFKLASDCMDQWSTFLQMDVKTHYLLAFQKKGTASPAATLPAASPPSVP